MNTAFQQQVAKILTIPEVEQMLAEFIQALNTANTRLLSGEITVEDFVFLKELIATPGIEARARIIMLEGLEVSRKNSELALELAGVMASGGKISQLKPLLILNIHYDPAMYLLLQSNLPILMETGYRNFAMEDSAANPITHEEWLKEREQYIRTLTPTQKRFFALMEKNTDNILQILPEISLTDDPYFQQQFETIRQDGKSHFDSIREYNQIKYYSEFLTAIMDFNKANASTKFNISSFDHRSEDFPTDHKSLQFTIHLSNVAFCLKIALSSFNRHGTLLTVGAAHAQGILNLYKMMFADFPQPMAVFPCNVKITNLTPNFISDNFRLNEHFVRETNEALVGQNYILLDVASDRQACEDKFRAIIRTQQVAETTADVRERSLIQTSRPVEMGDMFAIAIMASQDLVTFMDANSPLKEKVDVIKVVATITIEDEQKYQSNVTISSNLNPKHVMALEYQYKLIELYNKLLSRGLSILEYTPCTVQVITTYCIAGNVGTIDLSPVFAAKLSATSGVSVSCLATPAIAELMRTTVEDVTAATAASTQLVQYRRHGDEAPPLSAQAQQQMRPQVTEVTQPSARMM